ncbi:MAG: glycosyltransferase family 2 protein [Aggregatilineales bacterium]
MNIFPVADLPAPPPGKQGWPWTYTGRTRSPTRRNGSVWPRISIVTPSFNQAEFLEETIRSVLMQGYPNLEYIVIDGGSSDHSVEIIAKYAPFLDYWISEPDRGQAHAINKGLTRSTGAILSWLNSDDMLMPNSLFHIARAFMADHKTKLVCGLRKVVDAKSCFKRNWICDLPTDFYMRKDCVVAQETVYWRRELWEQVGPLDESMHFALDYEYWLRLLHAGYHFRLLPHYIGIFREHEMSKTSTLHVAHDADLAVIFERYIQDNSIRLVNGGIRLELGIAWSSRYQVIQQLCRTHLFDAPYVAIVSIYLLSLPFVQILFTLRFHYWIYQVRLRAQGRKSGWTNLAALKDASLKSIYWLGKVLWARGKLGRPLSHIEADAILARAEGLLRLPAHIAAGTIPTPVDGIFIGSGWFNLEFNEDSVFRWINNDVEIIITAPSGNYNMLYLTVECGPGYMAPTLDLQILDSTRQPFAAFSIVRSATIAVPLALTPNQDCVVVLHACQIAQPLATDPRILTMRVLRIAWTPIDGLPQILRLIRQNVRLEFDQPINGTGWCVPEHGPNGWATWTDSKESTVNLWLALGNAYDIQFRIVGALQPEIVKTLVLRVNSRSISLTMNTDNQGATVFQGIIPASLVALNQVNTVLTFSIDQVYSPKLLGLNDDPRFLGLAFNWLEIKPVCANMIETGQNED